MFIAKKANYIVSNLLWFLRTHIYIFFFTSETCDSSLKPLGKNPKHMLEANLRLILLLKGNNPPLLKGVSSLSLVTICYFTGSKKFSSPVQGGSQDQVCEPVALRRTPWILQKSYQPVNHTIPAQSTLCGIDTFHDGAS